MKINSGKSIVPNSDRSRLGRLRRLKMESLENRLLMAADSNPLHNALIPEDVNGDFRVTPTDVIQVIRGIEKARQLRRGATGESAASLAGLTGVGFADVNNSGSVTGLDALEVLNRLRLREGESSPLMRYTYTVTSALGSGTQLSNVAIGTEFFVNVFVQDLRDPDDLEVYAGNGPGDPEDPTRPLAGFSSAGVDLGVTGLNRVEYVFPSGSGAINDRFFEGVLRSSANVVFIDAFQGGGIDLGTTVDPTVNDGDTFSITNGGVTVNFELDSNSSLVNPSFTRVTLPAATLITYDIAGTAISNAVNGSTLGISNARFNGESKVVLPEGTTFAYTGTKATPPLTPSLHSQEYFDEVIGIGNNLNAPLLDPLNVKRFFSVRMRATSPGSVTFTPNVTEARSANQLLGSELEIIPSMIDFGSPFSINVISDPTGPQVTNDTLTTTEDVNLNISRPTLLSNDTSGATPARTLSVSSIQVIAGVTKGTLAGDVYTPPLNLNGDAADFLTYTVTDTSGLTATGTITINLTPFNDAPDAVNDNFSVVVGSTDNELDVLANDSKGAPNESSQTLTITAVGTPSAGGTVTISGGSLIYTPNGAFVGTETFTYTIQDNGDPARSDTATVSVDVQPATRPFAVRDRFNVLEDSTAVNADNRMNVLANDLVNVGQTAILVGVVTAPTNGTAVLDAGQIVYTPNPNFFGIDTFTYSMNESTGTGANSVGTVTVTVANVNDTPVPANDTVQAEENVVRNIAFAELLGNDDDKGPGEGDQTLTVSSVQAITVGGGDIDFDPNNPTNLVYSPPTGFSGIFLFTYQVTDNGTPPLTSQDPATVTITVRPFNDPPELQNDTASGTEGGNVTIALSTLLSNDSPGPGETSGSDTQTLSVTSVAAVTASAGSVAIVGSNVVYTPAANFNGPFVFTYTATDTGFPAKSETASVTVNMAAVNDAPVVGADSIRAFKNNPMRIPFAQLLANDTTGPANESTQVLSLVSVQNPSNGTVQIDTARSEVVFTPAAEFVGAASFQYTVRDNGGGTDTTSGNVSVTVEEFLPSSIGGTVWVDETKDNIIGEVIKGSVVKNERYLGGIEVVLTGTSLGQTITPQTAVTLADGTYQFVDLGPGSYQISFDSSIYASVPSRFYTSNVMAVNIAEPGGVDATHNYAVFGINSASVVALGRLMDQLVSQYHTDSSIGLRGAMFGVAKDNSLMWGLKLEGFASAIFTEAVFDGADLLVTVVDANRRLRTARVSNQFFSFIKDSNGDMLVRLIGSMGELSFVDTSLANPAFTARNYLASVDALFDQRGW